MGVWGDRVVGLRMGLWGRGLRGGCGCGVVYRLVGLWGCGVMGFRTVGPIGVLGAPR